MFEFLGKRLAQVKERRAAAVEQALRREELTAEIKRVVPIMKELLRDPRYQDYTKLLSQTRASCLAEREGLLRHESDADPTEREGRIAVLTGRIQQLDYILDSPERFLSLAEQGQGNGASHRVVPEVAARSLSA